ncbi:MAG TPA: alpha/beta hydrolase [Gammaproteobacteria bacterium]|nr:alpha/beta hydrolase [Gammaproteobacteria bacterium]
MTSASKRSSASPFSPAVLSQEGTEHRERLRQKLGLATPLAQREALRVGGGHCEVYAHASADAPVVVFLAGIGTYCELYAHLLHGISQRGFHVMGMDLRGHGYSSGDRGAVTVNEVIADAVAVMDALQTRFSGPIGVYGYSIGATLGASVAVQDDRVQALLGNTLLLPEVAPDALHQMGWQWTWASALWLPHYRVPLQQFVDLEGLVAHTGAAEEIAEDPLLVDHYPLRTLSSFFSTRTGLLATDRPLPVAIVHGDADEVLPLSYSEKLCARSPFPLDLIVAPGHGHMLPWEDASLSSELVAQWMNTHLV